jgi:hypothetical protein
MDTFAEYLSQLDSPQHQEMLKGVLAWIMKKYPDLTPRVAWNQPMFVAHGTFIIGFSAAKNHFSVAPERAGMIRFSNEIAQSGYEQSKMFLRIKWTDAIDYDLLGKIIEYNLREKADCHTFWR